MNTTEDKINQELEDGTLVKADTLEALAQKLNIDTTTFVNTIERYNTFVEQKDKMRISIKMHLI